MEVLGDDPNGFWATIHSRAGGTHTEVQGRVMAGDLSQGFHTYGVRWTAETIDWFLDGRRVFSAPTSADLHGPMYLLVNLAVGGKWPGSPDAATPFPAEFAIRRITVHGIPRPGSPARRPDGHDVSHRHRPHPGARPRPRPPPVPARTRQRRLPPRHRRRRRDLRSRRGGLSPPGHGERGRGGRPADPRRGRGRGFLHRGPAPAPRRQARRKPGHPVGGRHGRARGIPSLLRLGGRGQAGSRPVPPTDDGPHRDRARGRLRRPPVPVGDPLLLAPELRGQHETLWVELIRRQARATTLQAETDGKDAANLGALSDAPLPRGTVATVADTELRDLKARSADFARQRAFQERALDQIKANVSALEASHQQQTATVNRQAEAGERIAASYARGVSPVMRVEEDNRSLAGLRSQLIETTARLVVARKERDEGARGIERLVEDRRQRLLRETQDTFVEVERLRAQVRATGEKLLYTGAINAQLRRGAKGPELVVHRKVEGGPSR